MFSISDSHTGYNVGSQPEPDFSNEWPLIAADDLPVDILLPRLQGVTQPNPNQWSACCPAHRDSRPSLSVTETDDYRLLVYCHAGCDPEDIMGVVGLKVCNLFPSDYAIFKALKKGKRKQHALHTGRPAAESDPAIVPDWLVESMTSHAKTCFQTAITGNHLPTLGQQLLLPTQALFDFGVGVEFPGGHPLWTFPERDANNRIVGIVIRTNTGKKWCEKGSRRGLIIAHRPPPNAISDPTAPLYIPEGHTDCIALYAAGCLAIGRPAARLNGAAERWLADFLLGRPHLWQERPIVVTGDNDSAGRQGAQATAENLSRILGKAVVHDYPPYVYNDMRDWIISGKFKPGWPFPPLQQPTH